MTEYLDTLLAVWPTWALVVTIGASILVLGKGADVLVENAVAISLQWGVPSVVVGATVVSLGTTTPEAVVSVLAAVAGESGLALGNAVGSIICDTGLILGIACIISPLPFGRLVATRQGWVQFFSGVLLVAACIPWASLGGASTMRGVLPQSVGWLFLALLGLYMHWSVQLARKISNSGDNNRDDEHHEFRGRLTTGGSLAIAITVVVISSSFLISSATQIAERLEVPPSIIAATLVAFGTSLPELVIVITATLKGQGELGVGNVVGADILNVLFVAGAAAAVTPEGLIVEPHFFVLQFPAMLFVLAVFRLGTLTARDGVLRRPFGYVLLGTYGVVTGVSYLLS